MAGNLSDIASECPLCDDWQVFTGETVEQDGRTYAVIRCRGCGTESNAWNERFEPALARYDSIRPTLINPAAYDLAWRTLRMRQPKYLEVLIRSLYHNRIWSELPFFRHEHLSLSCDAEVIEMWARVIVEHPGFRPLPTPAERIEEALALAMHFDNKGAAKAAASHVRALSDDTIISVIDRLHKRMGGAGAAHALVPFFSALIEANGAWAAYLERMRKHWSIAELREAARTTLEAPEEVRVYRYFSLYHPGDSFERRHELLLLLRALAESQASQGTHDGYLEAEKLLDDALAVCRQIIHEFGESPGCLRDLVIILRDAATVAAECGEDDRVSTMTREALKAIGRLRLKTPDDVADLDDLEQRLQRLQQ